MPAPAGRGRRDLARKFGWTSLASIVQMLAGLASVIILTRFLLPSDYGLYGIALMAIAAATACRRGHGEAHEASRCGSAAHRHCAIQSNVAFTRATALRSALSTLSSPRGRQKYGLASHRIGVPSGRML